MNELKEVTTKIQQQMQKQEDRRDELLDGDTSQKPVQQELGRIEGYITAKGEDLRVLGEYEKTHVIVSREKLREFDYGKWMKENEFSESCYPIKRFVEKELLAE